MDIEKRVIKVRDLVKNYSDNDEGGVYGFDNKLVIRPIYQREFVYKDKQRDAVINSIRHNFPLNIMYWAKIPNGKFEVLDGQQRTISICRYVNGDYSIDHKFFHGLTQDEQDQILDYELDVYVCDGTDKEKLDWFKIINIAGETLEHQEILNAIYSGAWVTDAKRYFSQTNSAANSLADGYINGVPIRQKQLERALKWAADKEDLNCIEDYMAKHENDKDASELWQYFQQVISWAKMLFPTSKRGITDVQDWGILYNKYKNKQYNYKDLNEDLKRLLIDDDVTSNRGIIAYLLSDRTSLDEKNLNIRAFTTSQKRKAYEMQDHMCPLCKAEGNNKEYKFEEMEGDHVTPWSQGGKTELANLQMLCKAHNRNKSNK